MIQHLIIPGELPDLNQIIAAAKQRGFARKSGKFVPGLSYASMKRKYTEKVMLLARAAKLRPIQRPCRISFTWWCKNKRKDMDNIRAGTKFILDGLIKAGVLPNDTWEFIRSFHDDFFLGRDDPRVHVELDDG